MGQTGSQANLNSDLVRNRKVAAPPLPEQRAIASALAGIDALLDSLEELLTKKRQLKQAAMQELLTGKTRLEGFEGKWEGKRLGDICSPSSARVIPSNLEFERKCVEMEHLAQNNGVLLGWTISSNIVSQKSVFHKGDVLFGKLRPYLR